MRGPRGVWRRLAACLAYSKTGGVTIAALQKTAIAFRMRESGFSAVWPVNGRSADLLPSRAVEWARTSGSGLGMAEPNLAFRDAEPTYGSRSFDARPRGR